MPVWVVDASIVLALVVIFLSCLVGFRNLAKMIESKGPTVMLWAVVWALVFIVAPLITAGRAAGWW
jgi:hypothetical protein